MSALRYTFSSAKIQQIGKHHYFICVYSQVILVMTVRYLMAVPLESKVKTNIVLD